jgi:predicted nucleotidyltransferase
MADPNIEILAKVADALGELRERMTFVGGCATGLLITDPGASTVRATRDVDAVVAVVSLAEYHQLGAALRAKGFAQPLEEGAPAFRWSMAGLMLDVMPSDPRILGFSNRWYDHAMRHAYKVRLARDVEIRVADAPSFIATKLEAFLDRGAGDYLSSHDLEDVLSIVDGRPELLAELRAADPGLRAFVRATFARLLANEGFLNALPGLVLEGSPATRTPIVLQRLRQIAELPN